MLDMHIVIFRSYGDILDLNNYNCQELGLAKALLRRGFKVTFLMPEKDDNDSIYETTCGVINIAHIKIKWKIHSRYCWFKQLEKRLEKLAPSILQVHDMDLLMTWRAVRWAKKAAVPCFLIQGPYDKWKMPLFRQLNELYNITLGRYVLKNVTKIGVKTALASEYLNRYVKCVTYPTIIGLDCDNFEGNEIKDWKTVLQISDKKVLLYIGSLQSRRNPLFLIDILKLLPSNYVLLLVGSGKQEKDVANKILENKLQKRCIMLGKKKQSELPSIYASSDCFLLASDYEILGMVIMEAMYFGKPVISTKTTGAEFIINDGEDGIIIDNKDANTWANAIISILSDDKKCRQIGEAGRKKIINHFSWDKTCEGFIDLYFGK